VEIAKRRLALGYGLDVEGRPIATESSLLQSKR
jgi:hypothetical protein